MVSIAEGRQNVDGINQHVDEGRCLPRVVEQQDNASSVCEGLALISHRRQNVEVILCRVPQATDDRPCIG